MILEFLIFVVAILGVAKSADYFLSSAEKIGNYFHLPRFIMGVILVGLGTSLPELTTSIAATINNEPNIVIGNILGSNIANVLLILGITTILVGTVRVEKELVDIDLPLLLATSILFGLLAFDGNLSLIDGAILAMAFVAYLVYSLFYKDEDEYHHGAVGIARAIIANRKKDRVYSSDSNVTVWTWLILLGSLIGLAVLSSLAIENLLKVVEAVGVPVQIASFFALAMGTSLPELAVSIKALRKGDGDVVVGNIIGSSMFNILLIGGVASLLGPQNIGMPAGYWMLTGMIVSALMMTITGITRRIHIWEGVAFLFVYLALSLQIV